MVGDICESTVEYELNLDSKELHPDTEVVELVRNLTDEMVPLHFWHFILAIFFFPPLASSAGYKVGHAKRQASYSTS